MLIVCEGAKTEPGYFRSFPITSLEVSVVGVGANTLTVVEEAVTRRDRAQEPFDQVWAVFDTDSFPNERIHAALALARREGVRVAWSNEAFELWFLLHFEYCESALSRTTYADRISRYIGRPYVKNAPDMYDLLLRVQPAGIRNAGRLLAIHPQPIDPAKAAPATTVHTLVAELNQHLRR